MSTRHAVAWMTLALFGILPPAPLFAEPPKPRLTIKGVEGLVSLAFSPDSETLASAGDEIVSLWDVNTGKERAALKGHTFIVGSVAFSPDGKSLASGGWDGRIIWWDVKTGKELARAEHRKEAIIYAVRCSPDGKTFASGSGDGTIKLWAVGAGKDKPK